MSYLRLSRQVGEASPELERVDCTGLQAYIDGSDRVMLSSADGGGASLSGHIELVGPDEARNSRQLWSPLYDISWFEELKYNWYALTNKEHFLPSAKVQYVRLYRSRKPLPDIGLGMLDFAFASHYLQDAHSSGHVGGTVKLTARRSY